jgi:hypothetical protein
MRVHGPKCESQVSDPAQELIKALALADLEERTPVKAFDLLRKWKEK